jgi:hypothetical protein
MVGRRLTHSELLLPSKNQQQIDARTGRGPDSTDIGQQEIADDEQDVQPTEPGAEPGGTSGRWLFSGQQQPPQRVGELAPTSP